MNTKALALANKLDHEFATGQVTNMTGRQAAMELRKLNAQVDIMLASLMAVVAFSGAHGGPFANARQVIAAAQSEDFMEEMAN